MSVTMVCSLGLEAHGNMDFHTPDVRPAGEFCDKKYFTVNRKISMSSIRWCDSREKLYAGELIVFVLATCSTRLGAPYSPNYTETPRFAELCSPWAKVGRRGPRAAPPPAPRLPIQIGCLEQLTTTSTYYMYTKQVLARFGKSV